MLGEILASVKNMMGIPEEYTAFDGSLTPLINNALLNLNQLGVGNGTMIVKGNETWDDFLGEGAESSDSALVYVYCKVKTVFDPPASSIAMEALKEAGKEAEWKLSLIWDPPEPVV